MKVNYNIQKEERKAMVGIVGKALEMKPTYCGAPSFSYEVGAFEITKDGSLCFDDATDEATVVRVRTALREAGFTSEDGENKASCANTAADAPILTEGEEDEPVAVETAGEEPAGAGMAEERRMERRWKQSGYQNHSCPRPFHQNLLKVSSGK